MIEGDEMLDKRIDRLLRGGPFLRLIDHQFADLRAKYDLKKVDLRILYYLSNNSDHDTAREIQEYFNMNKGYISQTADRLQKRGYLVIVPDTNDHRIAHYVVTEESAELIHSINEMWMHTKCQILQGLTSDEYEAFCYAVNKIEENIENMLK